ncbi:AAA domain-containing protein [Methylobacter tundripaludum]|uniref:AAA domain-containing protein n=1 Tax=Methylobacter tundripaludum TaxID=173365 RepID=A0A2S6HBU6_9GAMM|nr:AAA family ATPase [Methylobacter tundripaludum]PPK74965.1 AAA domain-containing protein [Methylobacter tundripaludum]
MMQFKPFIIINHLVITKGKNHVYNEPFKSGVNIIRGKNSSGKSTIADFIFYALGGDLNRWKKEAISCDFTYIEVNLSGNLFTLRREIRESSKAGMDIFNGSMQDALLSNISNWLRYPYSATGNKESFYQAILKELGIPYAKSDNANSITLHQLLRLMYVDQMTSLDRLFKFDRFDNASKRKAIGELLIGLSDLNLYEYRLRVQKLESVLDNKIKEIQTLHKFFGSEIKTSEEIDKEINRNIKEINDLELSLESENNVVLDEEESSLVSGLRQETRDLQNKNRGLREQYVSINFELSDSEGFIRSLHARLEAIGDSSRAIDALSNIGYQYCPSCFEPTKLYDLNHCGLCGVEHHTNSIALDPTFKIRKEIEFQIAESNINSVNRQKEISIISSELEATTTLLTNKKWLLNTIEKPTKQIDQKTRELFLEIGRLNSEIQQLSFSKARFANLYDLYKERDATQNELNGLTDKVNRLEGQLEREMASKKKSISSLTKAIIQADTNHEEAFINAESIEFDFGEDKVSIDDRVLFSASSMVYLKNAFRLALLQASCLDKSYLYPRFLLMDNVEDKGMEADRSHIFQHEIVRVSNEIKVPHQIIFTTSMIAPDLNDSIYCVGGFYHEGCKTLKL